MASYDFSIEIVNDGTELVIERKLVVKQPVVQQEDAKELKAFLLAIWKAESRAVVLRKAPQTTAAIGEVSQ